jgi:FAD/FMN-containing dehydrogenase/Fe-S oxidoreductase
MAIGTSERRSLPTLGESAVRPNGDGMTYAALGRELERLIGGEVRFDDGSRALYSTDASNYRQVPVGVVLPRTKDDVVAAVEVCRRFDVPVFARGGGTSLAGQCCNNAVVIDLSKHMGDLVDLDPDLRLARVEPGMVLDDLRAAAERHHLTFGPDPATHNRCTLGGMIGNDSCGVHSQLAGRTAENVEELEVLTYDGLRMRVGATSPGELDRIVAEGGRRGQIYRDLSALRDRYAGLIRERFPKIPRRASGYNLDELLPEKGFNVARALVGSESTCALVLEATVRLIPSPPARVVLVLGYPDVFAAADDVPEIAAASPIGLEGFDDQLVSHMKKKGQCREDLGLLPPGKGWLLAEFGGRTREEAEARASALLTRLEKRGRPPTRQLVEREEIEARLWDLRESGLGATARVPGEPDGGPGWEDSAVPPEALGKYLRDLRGLLDWYGYRGSLYGHFGQGCVHTRISFDFSTRVGVERYRRFVTEAAHLVVRYGGSLSGEHGDGQSRAELLPIMFGEELTRAFREFKRIWDPGNKLNPGKLAEPYRLDENLRVSPDFRAPKYETHFKLPEDDGSFARAVNRCVGVGLCRKHGGGTMCPSYMVTREEMHSTRGRARLLFEMMEGDVVRNGWRDHHVKEALDLCLACKACKSECPVNVDMATYKSEFLSHYYEGRLRPRSAYAFGMVDLWARLASRAPRFANVMTAAKPFSTLAKAAAGVARERPVPKFAHTTFRKWWRTRRRAVEPGPNAPRLLLLPDTFTNHFQPDVGIAAVHALEALGYRVDVPRAALCCGRPLYEFGFLDRAERLARQAISELRDEVRAGTPIVGLEPSCVAVFRDELPNLLALDADARRLSDQTFTLSEFLQRGPLAVDFPTLKRKAVVHRHCHHEAVLGFGDERAVLDHLGLEVDVLDSGCCGMAGAFGYEAAKYRLSMELGERVLLPSVRAAAKDTLVVADGFSCRTQIEDATDRRALHLSHVLWMALRDGPSGPPGDYPEQKYVGAGARPGLVFEES